MVYQKSLTDPFTGQPREILGEKQSRQCPMSKIIRIDWSTVNSCGKFLCQYQASRRAGKEALGLQFSFLIFLDT